MMEDVVEKRYMVSTCFACREYVECGLDLDEGIAMLIECNDGTCFKCFNKYIFYRICMEIIECYG